MTARIEIERALREIGVAQHGVATRRQLLDRGVSRHVIDRMLQTGRLMTLRRGLYQIGPLPLLRAAECAAVLACGEEARVSHRSAAVLLHLLEPVGAPGPVEVTVSRRKRLRVEGVRVHRVRDLRADEVAAVEGIPVTTPARTLLDLADTVTARELEQALAQALRLRRVTREEARGLLARHPGHRGARRLDRLLEDEAGPSFTRSEGEEKLLAIVRSARLPQPELNVRVLGHEVDFLWRSARAVAEVDGYAFHSSARSFVADRQRDAKLTAAGYRVLRFTWRDVTADRMVTVARLAQALAR